MAADNRDFPQVLTESYDQSLQRLKTQTLITDGVDALLVNPDGSINTVPIGAATESTLSTLNIKIPNQINSCLPVIEPGILSTNNSTITPLSSGATFTGTGEEILPYSAIACAVSTDQNGTLYIDFSQDNTNWDHIESYTITATTPGSVSGFFFQLMCEARYFRLRYINGNTAQGAFRLQTILKSDPGTAEVHSVSTALVAQTDALVTKGVIYGQTTGGGGGYIAVKVNPSGALTADVTQSGTWNINNILGMVKINSNYSNRSDTYTAAGNGTTVDITANPMKSYSIQVTGTGGAATAWDVRLEGSLDGTNFQQILQHTTISGNGVVLFSGAVLSPSRYFRSRCDSVTLGGATNIVTNILGMD